MDLIGHDTNFSVTQSVYEANFFDKRFVPSLVQRELVDGGLLGRKSGRGFYEYGATAAKPQLPPWEPAPLPQAARLSVHGQGAAVQHIRQALTAAGCNIEALPDSEWVGLEVDGAQLRLTAGRPASQIGAGAVADVAVFDLPLSGSPGAVLAWAPAVQASAGWVEMAPRWLQALGFNPQRLADAPGLVVARTIAMLINEAADAVHQGVCDEAGADAAMKLGVNYPQGPFEWLRGWGTAEVVEVLDALDAHYRGERYRASPGLRRRAWMEKA
jgi:3-hydroxybutyryl-CoA dehydrogenase